MVSTEENQKPLDRATDKCTVFAKTNMLCLDRTFIQDLRNSALTNSVSVHIRSRSTSPDRLFLLMLILSISCRTASAVLKYMQELTHKKKSKTVTCRTFDIASNILSCLSINYKPNHNKTERISTKKYVKEEMLMLLKFGVQIRQYHFKRLLKKFCSV